LKASTAGLSTGGSVDRFWETHSSSIRFKAWAQLRSYHLATQWHWVHKWELAFHVWQSTRAGMHGRRWTESINGVRKKAS